MPIKIPTFDELLKKVVQPKPPPVEEFDSTQASQFGYNLPPGWSLKRNGEGDALLSPRGLTFKNLKLEGGKIVDFQAFKGDKPVKLPTLASDRMTAAQPFPEPPGGLGLPGLQPPPLASARLTAPQPIPGMQEGELTPVKPQPVPMEQIQYSRGEAESIYKQKLIEIDRKYRKPESWEFKDTSEVARKAFLAEKQQVWEEYQSNLPGIEQSVYSKVMDILAVPFEIVGAQTRQIAIGTGDVGQKQVEKLIEEGRIQPLTPYEELPLWQQFLWESPAFLDIFRLGGKLAVGGGRATTRGAVKVSLNKGLDKWLAAQNKILPEYRSRLYPILSETGRKVYGLPSRDAFIEQATNNFLRRTGRTPNKAQAMKEAFEETVSNVEGLLIPRGTQTGAMAMGGIGRPAQVIKVLPSPQDTQILNAAQELGKKIGLDVEAIGGIAPNEYWVSITRKSGEVAGEQRFEWLKEIIPTLDEKAVKGLTDVIPMRTRGKPTQSFLPFKNIQDAQKFLQTGDTSLIAKTITQRGEAWTPEQLAKAREAGQQDIARRALGVEPIDQQQVDKLQAELDELLPTIEAEQDMPKWRALREQRDALEAQIKELKNRPTLATIKPEPLAPPQPPKPAPRPARGITETQAEARLTALQAKMTPEERELFQVTVRPEGEALEKGVMERPARTDQIGSTMAPVAEVVADIGGFEKTLSPTNRAKALEQMNMKKMIAGKGQSRKEYIEASVAEGAVVGVKEGQPALVFPDGTYMRQSEITKTALDYANFLIEAKVTPEVSQLKELGWTDARIAELDQPEIASIIRNKITPEAAKEVTPPVGEGVTGYGYHKTTLTSLQGILEEGMTTGDFTTGSAIDFPGEITIRVKRGDIPEPQIGEYGKGVEWLLPNYEKLGAITPDKIEVKQGRKWVSLPEYVAQPPPPAPQAPISPVKEAVVPKGGVKVEVTEYKEGDILKTGQSVSMPFLRNLGKAPDMGERFAQHIEPKGEYMNYNSRPNKDVPDYGEFEAGDITFNNPLVMEHKTTAVGGWKSDLSKMFGGRTGRALTNAIKKAGYDGIITTEEFKGKTITAEIVNISGIKTTIPPIAQPVAKPPTKPQPVVSAHQKATKKVKATQKAKKPETVKPEDAKLAHIEVSAPDGPKPPKPPTVKKDSGDIFKEITDKGYNERADQTLLRLHESAINNDVRRTGLAVKKGGTKLNTQDIGVWRRDHLIPRPKDIARLDELYVALHNPSGVESGKVKVPNGLEAVYEELRALADWETAATLDFDPKAATLDDWFFRGWKPPEDMYKVEGGRLAVKPRALRTPRVDATYQEMRDLGFEPLFWNPYEQWAYRHNLGVKYREQMELVEHLKGIGEELIRPHDGGPIPTGWRVPEVGPAFEGKPFAMKDPDTGELGVMYTRRWITEGKVANTLENIYGKRPSLGKFVVRGREIDPMAIIDVLTFFPKRAKLFASYFQQVDFLTRAGSGGWAKAVDDLAAGRPLDAVKSVAKYPKVAFEVIQANFSPSTRLKLSQQVDSTDPIVQGRPGINLKGISEAGLSTIDVTIFPADMDKLVAEVAQETGILTKGKRLVGAVGDLESAMRRGLFQGVYPAAIITDIQNNIAPMVARQHPTLNDAQINSIIARIANIKYSTIPASQSVIQNRVLRETLRRLFFSVGESEGLLRQATNAFHGPNKRFWAKHWMGVYLFLITTASIIHFASTGEPLPAERFTPITKDKWGPLPFGYNTEFASPTLPIKGRGGAELTLDLAGQMDTAFRILDPVNFITSRESVPVRAVANQISGTDFYGAAIDDVGPGGIVSRTSQLLNDLFAPIGLGGITGEAAREFLPGGEEIIARGEDRLGYAGLAMQATGVNVRAETTMNLLDRAAKESGMLKADGTPVQKWDDLEPYQKNELTGNEDLETELGLRSEVAIERQQLGSLGFSTLDDIDKERIVRGEALMAELFSEVKGLSGTELASKYYEFRDAASELKREMSIRKAQVDKDFQLFKETGKIEKDPNKRARNEYYNTFDLAKKASGVMDWDKQATLEAILRREWTPAQEAFVDRNIGLTEWGPLFDVYEKDRVALSSFWDTPQEKRDEFLREKPEVESKLLLWGYRTTPTTIEAAMQLEADALMRGIPLESIQAFSLTDTGKERLPSDRDLWEHYFYYQDLPGTSYLNKTQNQVDAGELPEKYREAWEAYNQAKTEKAKDSYRKKYKEAAYSKWREDFRRANPEFDKWLIEQEYNKELPKKTISRTSTRVTPPSVFSSVGGAARPRMAKISYPKFKKLSVSGGMSVRAPSAPGV